MTGQTDNDRLEDAAYLAKGYRVETDDESKDMRLVLFGERGLKHILGFMVMTAPESYELATCILKNYDRLEGIK
jgi:hypothetical protein